MSVIPPSRPKGIRSLDRGYWTTQIAKRTDVDAGHLFIALLIAALSDWKSWPYVGLSSKIIAAKLDVSVADVETYAADLTAAGWLEDVHEVDAAGRRRFVVLMPMRENKGDRT